MTEAQNLTEGGEDKSCAVLMEELINRYPNVFSNDVEFIELGELVCNLELKESFVNNANLCKIREFIVDQYNNRKEQLSMKIKKIIYQLNINLILLLH